MGTFFPDIDWYTEVGLGNKTGFMTVNRTGRNPSVPNGSWAFVSELGATVHPLTTGSLVRVKAGDAADTSAGAGARTIIITGINSATNLVDTETLTTNGASAGSNSTKSFLRIFDAFVETCGTVDGSNVGDVVIEDSAGTVDIIKISADSGNSMFAGYSIPEGKTGYFLTAHATTKSNQAIDVRLRSRSNYDDIVVPVSPILTPGFIDGITDAVDILKKGIIGPIPEKTDVWGEAKAAAGSAACSLSFELLLVDN